LALPIRSPNFLINTLINTKVRPANPRLARYQTLLPTFPERPMNKNPTSTVTRTEWLDEQTQSPIIDQHARKLTTFLEALADGQIDDQEIKAQELRVSNLLKEIEPQLDDALHAKVTELLCELTAYDLMQMLRQMQQTRPATKFRG
jgi:hypothetical protein